MHMTIRSFFFVMVLLVAVVCSAGMPANAAHFNFQVPYEFHKLGPDVNHVTIQCVVFDKDNQLIGSDGKAVSVNHSTGEAIGTISIPVNADADKSAFDARSYRCRITLISVVGANPPRQKPSESNSNWQFQPDTSVPFVQEVTGVIQDKVPSRIKSVIPRPKLKR
jgi:hypothetical protein